MSITFTQGEKIQTRPTAGPPDAKINADGYRTYQWPTESGSVECLSVTSIRKLVGEPFGLVQWQIGKVLDRALTGDMFDGLGAAFAALGDPDGNAEAEARLLRLRKWLRAATTEERDKAATKGINIHGALELGLTLDECNEESRPYVAQVHDYLASTGSEIVAQEFQCWHLGAGYAGTADVLFRTADGEYVLGDWKTSKGVYVDHVVQLHAYLAAEFVGAGGVVDRDLTDRLHRATGARILHLNGKEPHAWTEYHVEFSDAVVRAFFGSVAFASLLAANKTVDGLIARKRTGVAP